MNATTVKNRKSTKELPYDANRPTSSRIYRSNRGSSPFGGGAFR